VDGTNVDIHLFLGVDTGLAVGVGSPWRLVLWLLCRSPPVLLFCLLLPYSRASVSYRSASLSTPLEVISPSLHKVYSVGWLDDVDVAWGLRATA
jgi:hypothetical protein